jgi:hypothetical protein
MFPFKYCRNCKHCGLDMKALNIGVLIDKCHLHNILLLHPYLGKCKDWRKRDGK